MSTGQRTDPPPLLVDAVLGTGLALAIALIIVAGQGGDRPPDPLAYVFAAGFGALVLLHRSAPRLLLVLTVLALFAYYTLQYPPIGVAVPVVAALFAAADAGLLAWSIGAGTVVFAVSTYFRVREGAPPAFPLSYESVSNVALIAAAIALGSSVRSRRIRVAQQAEITRLTAEQAAREAELRVRGERERLSRDLHDTVGHTMSVIALQAGVAADAIAAGDPSAADAVQRIREACSRTLRDLGSMVRILRDAGPAEDLAVLSLAAVPDIVDAAGAAGVEVTTDIAVAPGDLAPPVDAAAYRVVQEAVTNVVKHAGAGRARIAARIDGGTLLVEVTDDGAGAPEANGAGGHGLAGMAERVQLLGGTLTTRSVPGAGFTVQAQLPVRLPS